MLDERLLSYNKVYYVDFIEKKTRKKKTILELTPRKINRSKPVPKIKSQNRLISVPKMFTSLLGN